MGGDSPHPLHQQGKTMAIKIDHSINTLSPDTGLLVIEGSAGLSIPFGVSGNRPLTAFNGTLRYNDASSTIEFFVNPNWRTVVSYSDGSRELEKYVLSFNNTTDWVDETTDYTITISSTTHVRGENPIVQIYQENGINFEMVSVDTLTLSNTGNVTISVPVSPDLRFAGKIIII